MVGVLIQMQGVVWHGRSMILPVLLLLNNAHAIDAPRRFNG